MSGLLAELFITPTLLGCVSPCCASQYPDCTAFRCHDIRGFVPCRRPVCQVHVAGKEIYTHRGYDRSPTCGHRAQVTSVTKVSRMRRSIISASGARLRVRGVFGLRGLQKSTAAFAASCRTRGAFAPASCFLGAAPCCQGASRYTRGGTRGQTRRHESGTNAEPGMAAPAPAPSGMSLVARISRVMLLSVIWCGR